MSPRLPSRSSGRDENIIRPTNLRSSVPPAAPSQSVNPMPTSSTPPQPSTIQAPPAPKALDDTLKSAEPARRAVEEPKAAKKNSSKKRATKLTSKRLWGLLLVGILIGLSLFLWTQYRNTQNKLSQLEAAQAAAQSQSSDEIIRKVSEVFNVSSNETPAVADVNDATKLQGKTFFGQVQNGDKVLIYQQAGKAIFYRPSINKVVDVAALAATTGQ